MNETDEHVMLTLEQLAGYAGQLARSAPGIRAVAVLSTDGILLASSGLSRDEAELLAATSSGLVSLAFSGSVHFDKKDTTHVLVAYSGGRLAVCAVNDRCVLAVLTWPGSQADTVLYEMARFAEAYGDVISPHVRPTLTVSAQP
jgi:hypothetical protein